MKNNLLLVLFLFFFSVHKVRTGAIKAPLNIITLEDISEDERKHIDAYNVQYERSKRSGSSSSDLLGVLKTLLAQGAKAKLRLIGRASAAASSSLASSSSSSSSGKSYTGHGYSYHPAPVVDDNSEEANFNDSLTDISIDRIDRRGYKEKPDPWGMKKAVLNTLLQAVKAIKGGVLALKGQLIKGGGYLLVGGGNLVKAKGEVITNLGKKIAKTAFRDMHSSEVHEEGSYGHYHPAEIEYGPPSGSGPSFPDHFHHADYHGPYPDDKSPGAHSGILILKRIPSGKNTHHGAASTITEYKAEEPTFGTIVGKLLSAASSSNPDSPVPFTDYRQTHPQPDEYPGDDHGPQDSHQQDQGNFDTDFELEPAFDSPEAHKVIRPESSGEVDIGPHNVKISQGISQHPDPPSGDQNPPKTDVVNFNGVPQGSNFGSFVNDLNPPPSSDHYTNVGVGFDFQNNLQLGGNFAEPPEPQNQQEPRKPSSPNIFDHNFAEPPGSLLHYNLEAPQEISQGVSLSAKFGTIQLDKNDFSSNTFLGPYNPDFPKPQPSKKSYDKYRGHLKTPPRINQNLVDPSSNLDLPRFPPSNFHSTPRRPSLPQYPPLTNSKRPPPQHSQYSRSKTQRRPPNFDIVKSVTYQLGPKGPTKI